MSLYFLIFNEIFGFHDKLSAFSKFFEIISECDKGHYNLYASLQYPLFSPTCAVLMALLKIVRKYLYQFHQLWKLGIFFALFCIQWFDEKHRLCSVEHCWQVLFTLSFPYIIGHKLDYSKRGYTNDLKLTWKDMIDSNFVQFEIWIYILQKN
jgi:hypothetical protein